ncbi:hypothetical protein SARC_15097, partial [Sphaeroforma arctica JP610]
CNNCVSTFSLGSWMYRITEPRIKQSRTHIYKEGAIQQIIEQKGKYSQKHKANIDRIQGGKQSS